MAPLFALLELAIAAAITYFAAKSFQSRGVGTLWWIVFAGAAIIGLAVGFWFGFCFEYQVSPQVKVISFPTPALFLVLESHSDGSQQWVDFVTPDPLLVGVANTCFFAGMSVAFAWLLSKLLLPSSSACAI